MAPEWPTLATPAVPKQPNAGPKTKLAVFPPTAPSPVNLVAADAVITTTEAEAASTMARSNNINRKDLEIILGNSTTKERGGAEMVTTEDPILFMRPNIARGIGPTTAAITIIGP